MIAVDFDLLNDLNARLKLVDERLKFLITKELEISNFSWTPKISINSAKKFLIDYVQDINEHILEKEMFEMKLDKMNQTKLEKYEMMETVSQATDKELTNYNSTYKEAKSLRDELNSLKEQVKNKKNGIKELEFQFESKIQREKLNTYNLAQATNCFDPIIKSIGNSEELRFTYFSQREERMVGINVDTHIDDLWDTIRTLSDLEIDSKIHQLAPEVFVDQCRIQNIRSRKILDELATSDLTKIKPLREKPSEMLL